MKRFEYTLKYFFLSWEFYLLDSFTGSPYRKTWHLIFNENFPTLLFFFPKLFPDVSVGGVREREYCIVPIKHYFNFYSPTPFFFLSLLKKIEGGKKIKKKLFTTRTNFATLSKEKVFTDNFNSRECYIGLSFSRIITEE